MKSSVLLPSAIPLPSGGGAAGQPGRARVSIKVVRLHTKVAANGRLGHAAIQCGDDGV